MGKLYCNHVHLHDRCSERLVIWFDVSAHLTVIFWFDQKSMDVRFNRSSFLSGFYD